VTTQDPENGDAAYLTGRRVRLTRASEIEMRPVVWAWHDQNYGRIAAGTLVLLGGRASTGKSSCAVWLAAQITRGTLPGSYFGRPRAVFWMGTEESWRSTVGPRLVAAGADLDLVFKFDVVTDQGEDVILSLPTDNALLEAAIVAEHAALVVIDPLLSVLGERIDAHKAREVRLALEPLAKMAERTDSVVAGLAHYNKSAGSDAISLLSGSHAFGDVPRAVFGFARDARDGSRVMTQVKNSLGRDDLPSLDYAIEPCSVETPLGAIETNRFAILGESERSVSDLLRDARGDDDDRTERDEAADWLVDYLTMRGGTAMAADTIKAALAVGVAKTTLTRARARAGVTSSKAGMAGGWFWTLEESTKEPKNPAPRDMDSSDSSVDSSQPDDDPERLIEAALGGVEIPRCCCGELVDAGLFAAEPWQRTHPGCACDEDALQGEAAAWA
jgi:hypothetical protein